MYTNPENNYGSSITAQPYGGPIARSLTSRSSPPITGNRSRDAMARAMSDQQRNASELGRQQFENQFQAAFQKARADDVDSLRQNALSTYRMEQKKAIDDENRKLREGQSMKSLAARLQGARSADKWSAMMDYTKTFLSPEFISPRYGLVPHTYGEGINRFMLATEGFSPNADGSRPTMGEGFRGLLGGLNS